MAKVYNSLKIVELDVTTEAGNYYSSTAVKEAINKISVLESIPGTIPSIWNLEEVGKYFQISSRGYEGILLDKITHFCSNLKIKDGFLYCDLRTTDTAHGSKLEQCLDNSDFKLVLLTLQKGSDIAMNKVIEIVRIDVRLLGEKNEYIKAHFS